MDEPWTCTAKEGSLKNIYTKIKLRPVSHDGYTRAKLWKLPGRARELCKSRGGRLGLPVPNYNSNYGLCGGKATLNEHYLAELRSCVEVEVAVLGT